MEAWTRAPGHPLITIEEKQNELELRQSRFFSSALSRRAHNEKTFWKVPITILRSNHSRVQKYFLTDESLVVEGVAAGEWLKLNVGEVGFWRTRYPKTLLKALHQPVRQKTIGPSDRLGLVRDVFDLAESREMSTVDVLEFVQNYQDEDDYTVWVELASNLGALYSLVALELFAKKYSAFARSVFSSIAKKMGWEIKEGEKHTDTMLRGLAIYNFGTYGDNDSIRKAQELFAELKRGGVIHPDLRRAVYNLVAENGGDDEYAAFLELHSKSKLQEEKNRIEGALTHFKDPIILKRVLDWSVSQNVRAQDTVAVIAGVFANPGGRNLAWDFVTQKWPLFVERYGGKGHMLTRLIGAMDVFVMDEKANEIELFFRKHPTPEAARTIEQILEKIRSRALWLREDKKVMEDWLISRGF
jgi:puromycin-sensitive aminopeptidase